MRYQFEGGVCVDTDTHELVHGTAAAVVQPQVFDVVLYLIENAERVITKEELLDNVWGDRFVSESALTSRIKSARQALGDDGKTQGVIRTVHGRGYRWVAEAAAPTPTVVPAPDPIVVRPQPGATADRTRLDDPWPSVGRHRELDLIGTRVRDIACNGVVVVGEAGIGKSRLAAVAEEMAERAGIPTARVQGYRQSQRIPLACLAHLFPETDQLRLGPDDDLSRAMLFGLARSAVEATVGDQRMVLVVDDADLVDDLSVSVLLSLLASKSVFVIATQRLSDDGTELTQLLKDDQVERIDLGPLDDELLAVGLYRALQHPIDPTSLRQLLDAAAGNPGVLRELVEASIHGGGFRAVDGVWQVVGDLVPSADLIELVEERLGGLDDTQRWGAELLAIAGDLDLEVATALIGEEQLDAFDLRGLVELRRSPGSMRISLAHPLYGEVLRSGIQPLRERRLKGELLEALEGNVRTAGERLRQTQWRLDIEGEVDGAALHESAQLAILQRDHRGARALIDRLCETSPSAAATQLDAELNFREGRAARVIDLLRDLDVTELSDPGRVQVARRLATTIFFVNPQSDEPATILEAALASVEDDRARLALQAQQVSLGVMAGDVVDVHDHAAELLDKAEGTVRLELLRSMAYADSMAGRYERALEAVTEIDALMEALTTNLSRPSVGLAHMAELISCVEVGDVARGERLVERLGHPTTFGWYAIGAAHLAVSQGRPRLALERVENPLGIAQAMGQENMVAWIQSVQALAHLRLGDLDRAIELQGHTGPTLDHTRRLVDNDIARRVAQVMMATGDVERGHDLLVRTARHAAGESAWGMAARSLHELAQAGGADMAADLVDELGFTLEGDISQLRFQDIAARARADVDALGEVARVFEESGMPIDAALAHQCRAELDPALAHESAAAIARLSSTNGAEFVI